MNYQIIELTDTQFIYLPYDDDGKYYCPVCGDFHNDIPSYNENGTVNPELCSSCGFMAGKNDVQSRDWPLSHQDYLNAFRVKWLDEVGWTDRNLEQLTNVLEIDIEEIEKSAAKLRSEWNCVK